MTSHTDGQIVSASTITVSGTAGDNVGVTSVTVNGQPATGTTAWSRSVTLAVGSNLLTVEARDAAGNLAAVIRTITYQPTPPATTCTLNGVTYALGAEVTITMKTRQAEDWLAARLASGWTLVRRTKLSQNRTTVTVKCGL